jgi:hypothetical protein
MILGRRVGIARAKAQTSVRLGDLAKPNLRTRERLAPGGAEDQSPLFIW